MSHFSETEMEDKLKLCRDLKHHGDHPICREKTGNIMSCRCVMFQGKTCSHQSQVDFNHYHNLWKKPLKPYQAIPLNQMSPLHLTQNTLKINMY